jgi:hypothetical protein
MGHMSQRHQNIRSTSKDPITSNIKSESETPAGLGYQTRLVYAMIIDKGKLYVYLAGIFLVTSSKGT